MKPYWVSFIEDYKDSIALIPIITQLEMFYYYSKDDKEKCANIHIKWTAENFEKI